MKTVLAAFLVVTALSTSGCVGRTVRRMEVTAYCGCGRCSGWERGSWKYLKLDFWNRYVSAGKRKGHRYYGLTASGTKPHQPHPGLFSLDSLAHPWMIPMRIVFFPWLLLPRDGTVAADTKYYPFGTRLYIPGYGYGVVEDRGGAIKGNRHLDVFFRSHNKALKWGRKKLRVKILD